MRRRAEGATMLHRRELTADRVFVCAMAWAALMALGALVSGCASHGEKMVQSYTTTRQTLAESQGHVDGTLIALVGLRRTPPEALKDSYGQYTKQVTQLENDAQQ